MGELGVADESLVAQDIASFCELARVSDIWPGLPDDQWQEFLRWAVFDNPYRGKRPAGMAVASEEGRLDGAYLRVHVPFDLGTWSGIAAIPMHFCVRADAGKMVAARLYRRMMQAEAGVVAGFHTNAAGAMAHRDSGSTPCAGSDASSI